MAQIAASSRAVLLVVPLFVLAACGGGGAKDPVVGLAACSPLAQTGCGSGQKCAWFQVDSLNGIGGNGCAPVGARTAGQACVTGPDGATTGFDDCAKGLSCVAGECRTICDQATGTTCSALQACSRYAGHFGDDSGLGVCDPTCDPLTQARLTDGAAACGSPDPATPTLGCYGVASADARPTRFLCAPVPAAALGKTHRQPALGPAGGAFLNGCAPGYLPLLRESSSSSTVVCIALCAPLPVHLGSTAGLGGQAPRTCAAAGATGAGEECVYWWMLEDAATEVSTFSNGLGYCFDHTLYTYGDPPAPFPSCTTLAANDADANGTPDWLEFGCGPKP